MDKLKIFFLTNIFTNESHAFIPYVNEEIKTTFEIFNELPSDKLLEFKETINNYYYNSELLKNDTYIHNINIENYNINDLKKLIYKITTILPHNQLIFVKNNNIIDYTNRLENDKLKPKYRLVEEPLGFYYKNNLGKRFILCNLTNNEILEGNSDGEDIFIENNIILSNYEILKNELFFVNFDDYKNKFKEHQNVSKIKTILFPYLKGIPSEEVELFEENRNQHARIIEKNNLLINELDNTNLSYDYFNIENSKFNNLIVYSKFYEKQNLNLKEIFENLRCNITIPHIKYRNFIKNNLYKIYKYGINNNSFDEESIKYRINDLRQKIKYMKMKKVGYSKISQYEIQLKSNILELSNLKRIEKNHYEYKNYLNIYNTNKDKDNLTIKTFEEWKGNPSIPKESYISSITKYDNKLESIVFKIRYESDLNEHFVSFILFNNGDYHIKFLNENDLINSYDIYNR